MRDRFIAGATTTARLDELDKEEFRAVTRGLWLPGYTDADFDHDWAEFAEMKRRREMN
jgi:hypothetical protein